MKFEIVTYIDWYKTAVLDVQYAGPIYELLIKFNASSWFSTGMTDENALIDPDRFLVLSDYGLDPLQPMTSILEDAFVPVRIFWALANSFSRGPSRELGQLEGISF